MKLALAFGGGLLAALLGVAAWTLLQDGGQGGARPAKVAPAAAAQDARAHVVLGEGQAGAIGLQLAGVATAAVADDLTVPVTVVPDESRISHIHTRVNGWIERLHVPNTGEVVRAGQPIADIFSQELYASQLEYLAAREMAGPPSAVAQSGRARLSFLGMSEGEIRAIEQSGKARRVVTLYAPRPGVLAHRGIAVGTAVDPSTEIAIVLDLARVWAVAEVPEAAVARVGKAMAAQLTFAGSGGAPIHAKVEFVDPMLTEATRTLKVRFSLPNPGGALRPGMYGKAVLKAAARQALVVARDAVVDTGAAQYVYVADGKGGYAPRAVQVGTRLADTVEITSGLTEGEQVVVSGVFLLDSESRLRASGGQGTSHGGHGSHAPATPAPPKAPPAADEHSEHSEHNHG